MAAAASIMLLLLGGGTALMLLLLKCARLLDAMLKLMASQAVGSASTLSTCCFDCNLCGCALLVAGLGRCTALLLPLCGL